jgi:dephospho-CoA kinase
VGAGKSVVSGLWQSWGAVIIDTDIIARQLTAPDGGALPALTDYFGPDCLGSDGALNRVWMRQRVFSDPEARHRLEGILHPLIRDSAAAQLTSEISSYAVLVVPLLAENPAPYQNLMDRIAVVDCSEQTQLARTAARPGVSLEQAKAILAAQASRKARLALADDVIANEGDLAQLEDRAWTLHQTYSGSAKERKNPENSLP